MDINQKRRKLEIFTNKLDTFHMELENGFIGKDAFLQKVKDYYDGRIQPFVKY